jgi:hypothetical protein
MIKPTKRILFVFEHGVGDAVQFRIALKHLQRQQPTWRVEVQTRRGKNKLFNNFCRKVYTKPPDLQYYDIVDEVEWKWPPIKECLYPVPMSKVTKFLVEWGLTPEQKYYYYDRILKTPWTHAQVHNFMSTLPSQRFAIIHYEGTTIKKVKYFSHPQVLNLCRFLLNNEIVPIIVDWEKQSPLLKKGGIYQAKIPKTADCLAALIEKAILFVGIDSGPLHIAATTGTPSIGLWQTTHPFQHFNLSHNVKHYHPTMFRYCARRRTEEEDKYRTIIQDLKKYSRYAHQCFIGNYHVTFDYKTEIYKIIKKKGFSFG